MEADTAFIKQTQPNSSTERARSRSRAVTDRMFAVLLVLQWLAGIAMAAWSSPRYLDRPRHHDCSVELPTAVVLGAA